MKDGMKAGELPYRIRLAEISVEVSVVLMLTD